jgi:peptide/nickel transport system permease protein
MNIVYPRLLNSLMLTILAFALQIAIGIVLGVASAIKQGKSRDRILNIGSITIWSLPTFWVGIIMIIVFGVYLNIFPVSGMTTIGISGSWLSRWLDLAWHAFLPVLTLAIGGFGLYFRLTRASMLEVLRQDYITTAWSKGCAPHVVYFKHAFRNAILPLVTIIAGNAGYLLTGAVLIETIFSWPGVGYLLYLSIAARDYQMIQLIFVIVGILTILSNLLADLFYAFLDPRIRYT